MDSAHQIILADAGFAGDQHRYLLLLQIDRFTRAASSTASRQGYLFVCHGAGAAAGAGLLAAFVGSSEFGFDAASSRRAA